MARAGFTMIEITVIIAVLLILAVAVLPSVVSAQRSRELKTLEATVARLPIEAKNEAVRRQQPVDLRISGTMLIMETTPPGGQATQIKQVDLGNSIQINSTQLNGKSVEAGAWQWTAYPDGSADSGGIEFSEDGQQVSLVLPASGGGDPTWMQGALPDVSQQQWPAGQLQTR